MGQLVFLCYFFAILNFIGPLNVTDYCRPELCANTGANHIACGNNGNWGPECHGQPFIEPMTKKLRSVILKKHNTARNKIALGLVPGYLPADRMPKMSWNKELENIAMFNVKTCIYGHNPCSNTAMRMYSKNYVMETTDVTISTFIDLWFNEYVNCSMSYINSYESNKNVKIGHFTQMVAMRAKEIGCAAATFPSENDDYIQFYLVCNYSFGNMISEPIYTVGSAASKCRSGRNRRFSGLCNPKEGILPLSMFEQSDSNSNRWSSHGRYHLHQKHSNHFL